jgi:hypothetical protein
MNISERLHNQGNEQQATTPELELSMELRDICVNLLQEKGKNRISTSELIIQVLQPLGAIRSLAKWTKPQNLIRHRKVSLKKEENSEPHIFISCVGMDPGKADLDIFVTPDPIRQRFGNAVGIYWLRLESGKSGEIMRRFGHGKKPGIGEHIQRFSKATIEDLSYCQNQINQSSPIEHK